MFDVCYLIKVNTELDEIGETITTEEKQKLFCEVGSISRSEWDVAGNHGIRPSLMLILNSFEYNDETDVEYKEKRYSVYRTFRKSESNKIEIYLELKVGDDNG